MVPCFFRCGKDFRKPVRSFLGNQNHKSGMTCFQFFHQQIHLGRFLFEHCIIVHGRAGQRYCNPVCPGFYNRRKLAAQRSGSAHSMQGSVIPGRIGECICHSDGSSFGQLLKCRFPGFRKEIRILFCCGKHLFFRSKLGRWQVYRFQCSASVWYPVSQNADCFVLPCRQD